MYIRPSFASMDISIHSAASADGVLTSPGLSWKCLLVTLRGPVWVDCVFDYPWKLVSMDIEGPLYSLSNIICQGCLPL